VNAGARAESDHLGADHRDRDRRAGCGRAQTTARECESTLGDRLAVAEQCCAELNRQVKGRRSRDQAARVVVASRKLDEVPRPLRSTMAGTHKIRCCDLPRSASLGKRLNYCAAT